MRILSVVIAGLALTIVLVAWLERAKPGPERPILPSTRIHVTGPGNTLASVAKQVNDPQRFSYDPETRTAVAYASLVIEGELVLGRHAQAQDGILRPENGREHMGRETTGQRPAVLLRRVSGELLALG